MPDLDALIVRIGDRLQEHRVDPSEANALRQHPVLYEVVGKWPPQTPLRVAPAEIGPAIDAVRDVGVALGRAAPTDPLGAELETILQRLNESLDLAAPIVTPAPSDDTGEEEDAGDVDGEVVGKWPPD